MITLDRENPELKEIFRRLSTSEKLLDRKKLRDFLSSEYGKIGLLLYKRLKKNQSKLVLPIDYSSYCDYLERIMMS